MKMHHKKHDRNHELVELKSKTLEKMGHLIKKVNRHLPDEKVEEFNLAFFQAVREFFTKYLSTAHHATYEEIIKEINHKRIDSRIKGRTTKFLQKIIYVEYARIELGTKRKKQLFNEFKYLVEKLIEREEVQKKDYLKYPKEIVEQLIKKAKTINNKKQKNEEEQRNFLKQINSLLSDAKKALRHNNKESSMQIYNQIEMLSLQLEPHEIDKVYDKLLLAYKKKHPINILLEKAKEAFRSKNKEEAKRIYLQINHYYGNLPEKHKKEFYEGIFRIYKPKSVKEIEALMEQGYYFLAKKDMGKTKDIYEKLRKIYKSLPEYEKNETTKKIFSFYNDIREIFSE